MAMLPQFISAFAMAVPLPGSGGSMSARPKRPTLVGRTPWSARIPLDPPFLLIGGSGHCRPAEAGQQGAGCGSEPPLYRLSHRLYNPAPPVAELTRDFCLLTPDFSLSILVSQ
jgi:hypothetical protein